MLHATGLALALLASAAAPVALTLRLWLMLDWAEREEKVKSRKLVPRTREAKDRIAFMMMKFN